MIGFTVREPLLGFSPLQFDRFRDKTTINERIQWASVFVLIEINQEEPRSHLSMKQIVQRMSHAQRLVFGNNQLMTLFFGQIKHIRIRDCVPNDQLTSIPGSQNKEVFDRVRTAGHQDARSFQDPIVLQPHLIMVT